MMKSPILLTLAATLCCSAVARAGTVSSSATVGSKRSAVVKRPVVVKAATVVAAAKPEKVVAVKPVQVPEGVIDGTVVSMSGSAFGEDDPGKGQLFHLDTHSLNRTLLEFNSPDPKNHFGGYIPLVAPLSIVGVNWRSKSPSDSDWESFRAVSQRLNSQHLNMGTKVTLDAVRNGPEGVKVWILIEMKNRFLGLVQIEGTLTMPKTKTGSFSAPVR